MSMEKSKARFVHIFSELKRLRTGADEIAAALAAPSPDVAALAAKARELATPAVPPDVSPAPVSAAAKIAATAVHSEELLARKSGFASAAEMHSLVAGFSLADPAVLQAFQKWKTTDGTRAGLVKVRALAAPVPQASPASPATAAAIAADPAPPAAAPPTRKGK